MALRGREGSGGCGTFIVAFLGLQGGADHPRRPCHERDTLQWIQGAVYGRRAAGEGVRHSCVVECDPGSGGWDLGRLALGFGWGTRLAGLVGRAAGSWAAGRGRVGPLRLVVRQARSTEREGEVGWLG